MRKIGQISIFLILAIVLALGSVAGYYIYTKAKEDKAEAKIEEFGQRNTEATALKEFFEKCIRKAAYEGLAKLGRQGGYASIPPSFDAGGVALWQHESANVQPFLNKTQKELIAYLEREIPSCIDEQAAKEQGFSLQKGNLSVRVEFAEQDVSTQVFYPLRLTKQDFEANYDEFSIRIGLPYRRIFEVATELNLHILLPEYDPREPLKNAQDYGYTLGFERRPLDILLFTITDNTFQAPDNIPYSFSFAVKFGHTPLIKETTLQNHSSSSPTPYPFEVRSPDNKAILGVKDGTTITLDGGDVPAIEVSQTYPESVVTPNIPVAKRNKDITQRQDLKYIIENPIYTFEPSGLAFNEPQKLTLYYDRNEKTAQGVGILRGEKGFWVPIRSIDEPKEGRVNSGIGGFSEFTAVNCQSQNVKTVTVEHKQEASALCYVSLGITIVTIGFSIASFAGTPLVAGGEGFSFVSLTDYGAIGTFSQASFVQQLGATVANTFGFAASASAATAISIASLALSSVQFIHSLASPISYFEQSQENCQNFVPVCDSPNTPITKSEKDGTGKCVPESTYSMGAGAPSVICAQVEKCNFVNSYLCMPCSVTCSVNYK